MSELGELLRKLRGKMSLREASKKTGISHNYLSIIERGVDPRSGAPVNPTPETLNKLSEAYNYPYTKLMSVAGYLDENSVENEEFDEEFIVTMNKFIDALQKDEEVLKKFRLQFEGREVSVEQARKIAAFIKFTLKEDS